MIDIIIFAILALFIGRRLYKALGDTKHDTELSEENKKAYQNFKESLLKEAESNTGNTPQIEIASALEAEMSEDERKVFEDIRKHMPSFTADKFIYGAKNAFETILSAYSQQNKNVLEKLVSTQLLNKFSQAIDTLKANSQTQNITMVGIQAVKILSVSRNDSIAAIKLKFESEQISNIIDTTSGELVSGSLSRVIKCLDIWTFEKKINSKSNIWILANDEA